MENESTESKQENCLYCGNPLTEMKCEPCKAEYDYLEIDGEKCLHSKPRKVRLMKMPEEGDILGDIIKPL